MFYYNRQNFGNDTSDDDPEENDGKIYGHEEIIVRSSFATFLQKMIPQFESEASRDFFLHFNAYNCCLACLLCTQVFFYTLGKSSCWGGQGVRW